MAGVWFERADAKTLNAMSEQDMASRLGLRYTRVGDDRLWGCFEVDARTRQPYGLLHGGVSCVVSESMGSVAANLCVDRSRYVCVGVDINASHLRGASAGRVTARCVAIRIGRRNHVWQTDLYDDRGRHLCVSRLTVAVIDDPAAQSES